MHFALDNGEDSISSNALIGKNLEKQISGRVNKETGKDSCCPSLTLKHRIIGYAVCTGLGK